MAHYVLYLPGKVGADPQHLASVGLGDLLRDGLAPEFFDVVKGPDGEAGICATWKTGNSETEPTNRLGDKKWEKSPKGDWWIGIEKNRPVLPSDLQRRDMLEGNWVTLADGSDWLVPSATRVPHHIRIGDGNEVIRKCKAEYQWYYDESMRMARLIYEKLGLIDLIESKPDAAKTFAKYQVDPSSVEFNIVDGLLLVGYGLSLNYRVTADIMCMMDCFDNESLMRMFVNVLEIDVIDEVRDQKKTEYATIRVSCSTNSGARA